MSSRSARVSSPRLTEGEVNDLIMKLQEVLPDSMFRGYQKAPATKILKEACDYIKKLHKEVDDLSENLAQLPPRGDVNDTAAHAGIIGLRIQQYNRTPPSSSSQTNTS